MPAAYHLPSGILVKQCTKCGKIKESDAFFKRACRKDGPNSWCKECGIAAKWISVAKNNDYYTIQNAEYREKTKERKKLASRNYRAKTGSTKVRLHKYGLTLEAFNTMREKQNYRCLLCFIHESECRLGTLCVDHNHETLKVRGLLCHSCNAVLGHAKESVPMLKRMIEYLGG